MKLLDLNIFFSILILIAISLSFMYGASIRFAESLDFNPAHFFYRQIIYSVIAVFILVITSLFSSGFIFRLMPYFLLFVVFALVLVIIPEIGSERNGARRWIDFHVFSFQPSEFAKIIVILFVSNFLGRKKDFISKNFVYNFFPVLIIVFVIVGLIFLEKDLSTSIVIVLVVFNLFFIAGVRFRYLFYVLITGVPFLYFLIMYFPYMKLRLFYYLRSFFYDYDYNFQIKQSFKAIFDAGVFGNGLGIGAFNSRVPESHTDFYFVSIFADIGIVGALFVLILYFFFCFSLFYLAFRVRGLRFSYFVCGVALLCFWQAILNLGSVLGLLPVAGIPFPLLSYGGNALFSLCFALGVVLSIARDYYLQNLN